MYTTKMLAHDKIGYNSYVSLMSPCFQVSIYWKNKVNLKLCYVFASSELDKDKTKDIFLFKYFMCCSPLSLFLHPSFWHPTWTWQDPSSSFVINLKPILCKFFPTYCIVMGKRHFWLEDFTYLYIYNLQNNYFLI
jgi:hypothetical protein